METKLTLKLDQETIEQAKIYAKKKNLSLSKMVEKYFKSLTDDNTKGKNTTKLVKELSGIIDLKDSANPRDEYTEHLIEKYK